MADIEGSIQLLNKPAAWFTDAAQADFVPKNGQHIYLDDNSGDFKKGDGVTTLPNLPWITNGSGAVWGAITGTLADQTDLNNYLVLHDAVLQALADEVVTKADRVSELLTGGVITVETIDGTGTLNDIRVTASTYYIVGSGSYSASETTFLNIALSSAGTQRYIGIYGKTDGTVTKVEGSEAATATYPATPASHAPFGYLLVSDGSIGSAEEPGAVEFADVGGNASDNASLVSYVSDQVNSVSFGYNVKNYGLVGDGVTDDRAALNTLLNTTAPTDSTIYFPPGTYLIGSMITVADKRFHLVGTHSSIIKANGSYQIFRVSSTSATVALGAGWTLLNLSFEGTGSGSAQSGIYFISNAGRFLISGCQFRNFANSGVTVASTSIANTTTEGSIGGTIIGCRFYRNLRGVNLASVGEYVQVIGCQFVANTTGILGEGGNALIQGNAIDYNTTGIEALSGTNAGKYTVVGNKINHNGTSLYIHDTITGFVVAQNDIIDGDLRLENNIGLIISGGNVNTDSYTIVTNTGSVPPLFQNIIFRNSLANAVSVSGTATVTRPRFVDCYNIDGRRAADPDNFFAENTTFTTNGTFIIPKGHQIDSISFYNTTANAVTGGIRIGTTNGGTEVIVAQAVGASAIVKVQPADILLSVFSYTADTTLYIQAVTAWNSANVQMHIKLSQLV